MAEEQEKTEQATPHRLQEARKKGQVAKSADLTAAAMLAGMVMFMYLSQSSIWANLTQLMSGYFSLVGEMSWQASPVKILFAMATNMFEILLPFLLTGLVLAVLVNLVQSGMVFSGESLRPKLERLNPLEGLKRIFSTRGLTEAVKSILKVLLIGLIAYLILQKNFLNLLFSLEEGPGASFNLASGLLWRIFLDCSVFYLVLALLDFMYQRYMHQKNLRMTRHEVKEEMRQMEGDPLIRGKQRERRHRFMQSLIRRAVPKATVVITNPVHLAVALQYRVGEPGAPRVVAKGAGELAQFICRLARDNNVPVVQNIPVARYLYKNVDVNREIPGELYQAVAEILAVIYRVSQKTGA